MGDNSVHIEQQPLDEYSRAMVMLKLENAREYYNRLLLDVIQQQSECYDKSMREIKKQIIHKLKMKSNQCDKKREAIQLWNKIQEMKQKNLLKKKEFQQTVNKTRQHKKEMDKLKEKYDKKEQRLREKQSVQQQIDAALSAMSQ